VKRLRREGAFHEKWRFQQTVKPVAQTMGVWPCTSDFVSSRRSGNPGELASLTGEWSGWGYPAGWPDRYLCERFGFHLG
jgi:hypothetical protein